MGKVEKHSPSRVSPKFLPKKSAVSSEVAKQITDCPVKRTIDDCTQKNLEDTVEDTSEMNDIDNDWKTVQNIRSDKLQRTNQNVQSPSLAFVDVPVRPNSSAGHVHSYFSSDENFVRSKPNSNRSAFARMPSQHQSTTVANPNKSAATRRRSVPLPPFKLEFENHQKPTEILVLNELVKHNDHLNVDTARYLSHHQSRHLLAIFANDSATYEFLLQPTSWPSRLCGLSFEVIPPRRIPTSYSVLVHRVPREWTIDAIQPLIAQRYPSVLHVARIFHDRQPINRI